MEPTPATMLVITTVVDLVTRASNGAGDGVSALVRERLAGTADGRAALAGMAGKHAHPASADASFTAALARAVLGESALGPPARPLPRMSGPW